MWRHLHPVMWRHLHPVTWRHLECHWRTNRAICRLNGRARERLRDRQQASDEPWRVWNQVLACHRWTCNRAFGNSARTCNRAFKNSARIVLNKEWKNYHSSPYTADTTTETNCGGREASAGRPSRTISSVDITKVFVSRPRRRRLSFYCRPSPSRAHNGHLPAPSPGAPQQQQQKQR